VSYTSNAELHFGDSRNQFSFPASIVSVSHLIYVFHCLSCHCDIQYCQITVYRVIPTYVVTVRLVKQNTVHNELSVTSVSTSSLFIMQDVSCE